MLLIFVDAQDKFIDAHIVSSATKNVTLLKVRQTFSHTIFSDHGSCFTSEQFEQLCRANRRETCEMLSNYKSASNGAAERAVQTVKFGLRKNNLRAIWVQTEQPGGEVPIE